MLFKHVLKGSHVKWFTNNQAVVKIAEVGTILAKITVDSVRALKFERVFF